MIATDGLDLFDSLGDLADLAAQSENLDAVLERATSMIAEITRADLCAVVHSPVAQGDPAPLIAATPADSTAIRAVALATWIAPVASRVRDGMQPLLVQSADASDSQLKALLNERGFASAVAVPVALQGAEPLVLVAFSAESNGFANADLGFMSSAASVLALASALHNSERPPGSMQTNGNGDDPGSTSRATWELSLTSGSLTWNDEMFRLLGLTSSSTAPTQELFDSLIDPRDGDRLQDSLRTASSTNQPEVVEYRVTRADGETRWLRQRHQLAGASTNTPRMLGTVWDVTPQPDSDEDASRGEDQLRAILDVSAVGFVILDESGQAVYRNKTYLELIGRTRDEMEHLWLEDLAIAPDRPRIEELRTRLSNGETHAAADQPITLLHPDGSVIHLDISITRSESPGQGFTFINLRDVSDRVAAERLVAEGETRFERVFETASSGLLMLGPDGAPQNANQAFLDIFGINASQLQDHPLQHFIVSEQQSADVTRCIEQHLAGDDAGCDQLLEIRRERDGELRRVSVTCQTLVAEGQVSGVLAEFTDLTEMLAAQEALEESERQLLEAEQVAGLGHWEWDAIAGTISASGRITELLGSGVDSSQFYERYRELLAPEDVERVTAASEAAFSQGEPFDQEYTLLPPDTDPIVVHEVIRIVFDDEGEAVRAFGTIQDITKRAHAERASAESESRIRAIFDASHTGISFFTDPDTPPFRNQAFADMLGYTTEEIEGKPLGALLQTESDRSWVGELWARIARGEPAGDSGLSQLVHKDGHLVDVDVRISGVELDGEVIGQVANVRDVTAELASRHALEESEARSRLIFDSSSSGMILMRLNGEIQLANQAFADIVGVAPEQVTTLKAHHLIDRRDAHAAFALFRARLRGDLSDPADVDMRFTRLDDGRLRRLRVEARPLVQDGEVTGMLCDVRDITERLETRHALEESQDRLRRAQANARIAGWEMDAVTQEIRWSDELYEMFGQTPGSSNPTIDTILQGTHPEDRDGFTKAFELAESDTGHLDIRLRYTGPDAQPRVLWSRGDLVSDNEGAALRWEGTIQDITELAEAQQALAASEARLNAAQESAQLGSWIRHLAIDEAYWSDELYRLFGLEPGSIPASVEAFRSFVHPDDREAYEAASRDRDGNRKPFDIRTRVVGADGVVRTLDIHAGFTVDEQGTATAWEGTAQDVTERAAAQEALAESEARLNLAQSLAHVGSWGRHIERKTGYWSDEFFRLLGLEPGDEPPSVRTLRKYLHPDDRATFAAAAEAVTDSENERDVYDIEVRVIGADGVERTLWMHGELTRDAGGNPVRIDGTGQDITELAAARSALSESTARLELAQSQAHVGSFSRYLPTGEVYWSDELYRLFGFEPQSVRPTMDHIFPAMHEDDRARFQNAVRDAVETGSDHYSVRSRITRLDGSQHIIWQHGELTRDESGKPLRWDGTAQDVTELQQAQEALAEREEFLRTTLEAVRSGVMVVNPERKIISANGNASQIMGFEPDEFLDVELEQVVQGEDLALMLGRFAARVRGESGPESTIVRVQRKDGVEISLDVRGAPLIQSGELRGIVVDFRDVTEELEVKLRLEDTANRLRTLFESVRSGLIVVGPDLVAVTCNDALAALVGSSADQIVGQSIDRFLLPEERDVVALAIEARMDDGDVDIDGQIPSAIVRTDGAHRHVDVRTTPFVVDGKPIGILCEVRDVTEELALQEEVQDTAERFNSVFETVSTGLIIVDRDQRPLTVNQALCDILDYSRDELMEKTLQEITHPDDITYLTDRFERRIAGGAAGQRHQSRAIRSDGSIIHVDISAEPFRIGGEVVGVLGEVRDITESLALQQEVENTAERLNTVFESVSTGLAVIGPDRRPLTVNQALCDMTGYSRAELLSRPFEQGLHPDDAEPILERFADRIARELEQRNDFQTRLIRKDGENRNIAVSSEPFHIGGQFIGVLVEIRDNTEELSLQRQVQETADRLNNVFESVSTGLLVISPERYPLTVNQALCDITGHSREQLLAAPFDDRIHQDDLPKLLERFSMRIDGDAEPFRIQARTVRPDGQTIDIEISGEPFLVGGEIVGVFAEVRDITEDLALQLRVQQTADRLNNVFETVSTGLAVVGADRVPTTMNQAFCDILGRTEDELTTQPFDHLVHPDHLELIIERATRRLAGVEVVPHHVQVQVIRGDGSIIDVDVSSSPFIVGGEPLGMLVELRDITEELSLQSLVTESAEQINTILEATPDAIVVADDNDVILRVNAATERVFGSGPEELIGQPVTKLVGGVDRAPHAEYVEYYKRTGHPSTDDGLVIGSFREAVGRRVDGTDFPAELAVAETQFSDGRKLFVAAIRDITERKQAEERLKELNTALETRSRERQALVQQLLSAQEEERRTVAYEIHDGPAQQLAAAQMFLEAFAFDQEIDPEDENTEHFQRAKAYLDTSLTETRRIMSGLRPALLDDLGLADALNQLLHELADRADFELQLDSERLTDELSAAVEITLYRITQEAASNALKHSGGDTLQVELSSDGSSAHLVVMDNGHGFNPANIQGPRDGRRYGLVGMRERVELLEGEFELDSTEGHGTVVRATIPLDQENE